jgi:proline dehydrogenase
MAARLPDPGAGHTRAAVTARTTVPGVLVHSRPALDAALRLAGELVGGGLLVALAPGPGNVYDLAARVDDAGLGPQCELTVPVVGDDAAALADCRASLALAGPAGAVDAVAAALPEARVVIPAAEPDAEARCRAHAGRRVRLTAGRGAAADLAFVRCLNVLMAAGGYPAVATTDRRLIALAGERAAWNHRTPDSWEHLMPFRVRVHDQRRLLAAGYRVRVLVRSGRGASA